MPEHTSSQSDLPLLTRPEMAKGLRIWLYTTCAWGVYARGSVFTEPIFTGFLLFLGATEAHMGVISSVSMAVGLIQILSVLLPDRIGDKKRFVILVGLVEVILIPSVVFIPVTMPRNWWIPAVFVFVIIASVAVNAMLPLYNTWLTAILPTTSRARYINRQTIANTIAAIVSGYFLGRLIDLFREGQQYQGFLIAFMISAAGGVGGYVLLTGCPFPRVGKGDSRIKLSDMISGPFRDVPFMRFLVCYLAWVLATGVAGPFYSVFMIKTLRISYTNMAVFTNISLAFQIIGYRLWAGPVDRHGSKQILRLLMIPYAAIPLLWAFNSSDNYLLIPFIMVMGGFLSSGISTAVGPLFYGLLPAGAQQPVYFAFWSIALRMVSAVAPLIGGALIAYLRPVSLVVAGFPVESIQFVFVLSSVLHIAPILLLRKVVEAEPKEPGALFHALLKGNFVTYAYSLFRLSHAKEALERARAMRAMGRSRSPMAVERLIEALDDPSPIVRTQAAAALGEARDPNALGPLLDRLRDHDSDIRPEAAEALGRLGHLRALDPLIEALQDEDPRVRISALRALSVIGGEEAHELMFWLFCEPFDKSVFPTLVEALSASGDTRIVKPTLERISHYASSAIRLQLLNGVCRTIGAGNLFYRMLSKDDFERAEEIEDLLERSRSAVASTRVLDSETRAKVNDRIRDAMLAFEREDQAGMFAALREGIGILDSSLSGFSRLGAITSSGFEQARAGILSIRTFLDRDLGSGLVATSDIFPAVCLFSVTKNLRRGRMEKAKAFIRRVVGPPDAERPFNG